MTERDLQRWSREVAEDPGAPSFVRLARAYRRQGRASAARDVVLAGLAVNPEHVDAHALLALLHIEDGDREQARDEWETVLSLDPDNFDASRGLGFLALERGDLGTARRHLDTAAGARPDDPAVTQARQVLERRERAAPGATAQPRPGTGSGAGTRPETGTRPEPGSAAGSGPAAGPAGSAGGGVRAGGHERAGPAVGGTEPGPSRGVDPVGLFSSLTGESPFRGALLFDEQGLVLAGRLEDDGRPDDLLGALLNTVVAEARRTAELLRLGDWAQMLLETAGATLHIGALEGGAVLVVVVERGAPAGWVVRVAGRARALAERFLVEER